MSDEQAPADQNADHATDQSGDGAALVDPVLVDPVLVEELLIEELLIEEISIDGMCGVY